MRLNAGGVRELRWHKKPPRWSFMLSGSARISAIDAQGRNFVDDVGVGDLWFFPGRRFRIRSRDSARTAPSSCWCSTTAIRRGQHLPAQRLVQAHAAGRAGQKLRRCAASGFGKTPESRASATFSARRCRAHRQRDKIGAGAGRPETGSTASHDGADADQVPRAARCGSPTHQAFPASKTISAALVEVEPGGCANCTGIRTRTSGSTTSKARPHGRVRRVGPARTFDFRANDVGYVPLCHGALYREHRQTRTLRFLGNLRRATSLPTPMYPLRPVAGADAARTGQGHPAVPGNSHSEGVAAGESSMVEPDWFASKRTKTSMYRTPYRVRRRENAHKAQSVRHQLLRFLIGAAMAGAYIGFGDIILYTVGASRGSRMGAPRHGQSLQPR